MSKFTKTTIINFGETTRRAMENRKLHTILETGVKARASDWYLREDAQIVLRVDGNLVKMPDVTVNHGFMADVVSELVTEKGLAQFDKTGDTNFAIQLDEIGRFRVNLYRQRGQMCMVIRFVKSVVPNLHELNLPEMVHRIAEQHRGIVLVTGTTGSGKSTTLACMMEHMNSKLKRHIITVEDPIEYAFKDRNCVFDQREVGLDTMSFQSALENALRQDPDVIVVGEMRTREGFSAALQAADTGHLVMTTLHTTNASQSIQRILDLYPESDRRQIRLAMATNLTAIISQRLMPRAFGKGVVPCIEIMLKTPIIEKLLNEDRLDKLAHAVENSTKEGMISFDQSLLKLVNDGTISEEMALERATNPEGLKMNLKGIFLNTEDAIIGN